MSSTRVASRAYLLLASVLALALSACGGSDAPSLETADAATAYAGDWMGDCIMGQRTYTRVRAEGAPGRVHVWEGLWQYRQPDCQGQAWLNERLLWDDSTVDLAPQQATADPALLANGATSTPALTSDSSPVTWLRGADGQSLCMAHQAVAPESIRPPLDTARWRCLDRATATPQVGLPPLANLPPAGPVSKARYLGDWVQPSAACQKRLGEPNSPWSGAYYRTGVRLALIESGEVLETEQIFNYADATCSGPPDVRRFPGYADAPARHGRVLQADQTAGAGPGTLNQWVEESIDWFAPGPRQSVRLAGAWLLTETGALCTVYEQWLSPTNGYALPSAGELAAAVAGINPATCWVRVAPS